MGCNLKEIMKLSEGAFMVEKTNFQISISNLKFEYICLQHIGSIHRR